MTEAGRLDRPITGRCLCGAVEITVAGMERQVDVCHCEMCARWSGAFYAGVEGESVTVTGEASISTYASSRWAERAFCSICGSNLWYRFTPTGHRSFLAGLFDLPVGFGIKHQIFVEEKPDWYDLAQDSPMKTGAEVMAEAKAAGIAFD